MAIMKRIILIACLCLIPTLARADSVWTYQGNSNSDPGVLGHPNPCGCALSGSLTLEASNNPIAWNFTEGAFTLDNTDSTLGLSINQLIPQGEPLFSRWFLGVVGADFGFFSIYDGSNFEATDFGPGLYVQGNKGVWTESAPVGTPEPNTILLLGGGISCPGIDPFASPCCLTALAAPER